MALTGTAMAMYLASWHRDSLPFWRDAPDDKYGLMVQGRPHLCGSQQLIKCHWWSAVPPRCGCGLILTSQLSILRQVQGCHGITVALGCHFGG